MANQIKSLIIHHELGSNGFAGVNEYHRQLWNFKSSLGFFIGYQYYLDKSGKVWQGRRDDEEGAHTKGRNLDSIGICLEGNLDIELPTPNQMTSLKALILQKMTEYAILPDQVFGHRKFASYKTCPGRNISDADIRAFFQPTVSYYQALLNSLKDMLSKIKLGKAESSCLEK